MLPNKPFNENANKQRWQGLANLARPLTGRYMPQRICVKFKFRSKVFAVIFWILLIVFILIDVLSYVIVIFPGKVDFDFFEHSVFFAWFIGKVAAFICLLFGRGLIKYCVYFSMFQLLLTGVYGVAISGNGFTFNTLYNLMFIFIAFGVAWLTNKFIVQTNSGN